MANYSYIDQCISKAFYKYGKLIARNPLVFLISPMFIVAVMSVGMTHFSVNDDVEYLFTPENSKAQQDLKLIQDHFLLGTEGGDFLPNRELELFLRRGRVIITARDGRSALRHDVLAEVYEIDRRIRLFNVTVNNVAYRYDGDLCQRWMGQCVPNQILKFYEGRLDQFDQLALSYPLAEVVEFGQAIPLMVGSNLGGYRLGEGTKTVEYARAIRLFYPLGTGPDQEELAAQWEIEFLHVMEELRAEMSTVDIFISTSVSMSNEINAATVRVIPRLATTVCMLVIFAVGSCIMRDWVLSKPWLALIGVLSAGFSVASAIGLLNLTGLQYNEVVSLMPFLILGVGVDNMFVMIAAWRRVSLYLSVEERMGLTFSEAGVSVTITNLTTVLAFIIGASSSLPGVRTFCIYAGVAMFFVYFYQMTFFGAAMSLMGTREANNLHCYTCKKVLPREQSPNKFYLIFCSGGISRTNHKTYSIDLEHRVMKFFRLYYGPFITKPWVKVIVLLGYVVYLAGAIYGCCHIKEGLALKNLAMDNTDAFKFYDLEDIHFRDLGPPVNFVLTDEVAYWDEAVQDRVENVTRQMEDLDHVYPNLTSSWLRDFLYYLREFQLHVPELVAPGREGFLYVLREHFLNDPRYLQYRLDISFDGDGEGGSHNENATIKMSRLIIQTKSMLVLEDERSTMLELRAIVELSSLPALVYHPAFALYESYVGIIPSLLQTLGIAMGCMFIVAVVMIPHPICALWVSLCVISIDTAVLGYMALWDVNVDPISMINIILCIGFSVDFSAHTTYAFVIAPKEDPNERATYALGSLGMAILQGALSSIIAISVLSTAPFYIFRTFFKTLFLVMVFGAMHGLVILPVVLTFMGRCMPHKVPEKAACESVEAGSVLHPHEPGSLLDTIPPKTLPGEQEKPELCIITTV